MRKGFYNNEFREIFDHLIRLNKYKKCYDDFYS